MKKYSIPIIAFFSLFLVVGNAAAVDLNGTWAGTMYCSHYAPGVGEDFEVEITQTGDFFTSVNIVPTPGQICGGVLDGNKVSMTCDDGTFAYGEIKGKTIYVINHIPIDAATCKGSATKVVD